MPQQLLQPGQNKGHDKGLADPSGYLSEQTIAALASAVGGAIAVIRMSGPRAFEILDLLGTGDQKAFSSSAFEARKLYRVRLKSPGNGPVLDDTLCVRFEGPESFTGEDVVELHVHGGNFTSSRILETLSSLGARQALPGEFSFRAVRNGKFTITQAQAVTDLIASTNDDAATLALEKLSGTQNELLSSLGENLRKLAVLGEVGIDFSDQDVAELSLPNLKKQLTPLLLTLHELQAGFDRGFRLQDGVSVAFVGLPNAGKSSFFNALLGEDRSIVSEIAGTTRDVIRERISLRGKNGSVTLRLEDTAGLRHTSDEIEKKGIARSHAAAQRADLILLIVDVTSDLDALTAQWMALEKVLGSALALKKKTLGIFTKTDLLDVRNPSPLLEGSRRLGISKWVQTSAQTGRGIDSAAQEISAFCQGLIHRKKGEVLLTRVDHLRAVQSGIEHLERAQQTLEIDLFASDIRQALHALGPLIGDTVPDDILGKIFSDFCIGK